MCGHWLQQQLEHNPEVKCLSQSSEDQRDSDEAGTRNAALPKEGMGIWDGEKWRGPGRGQNPFAFFSMPGELSEK